MPPFERIVIVGSGWGGYTVMNNLKDSVFEITLISPEPAMAYTPLLASAATSLIDFSLAEEPVRRRGRNINYFQATVDSIDFDRKICQCTPAFKELADKKFQVFYDKIVLSPGCTNQTFGTPGVLENALFVRNVNDARAVHGRLKELAERASLPFMTDEDQRKILHIAVVGGGPTGVEISAESYDLVHNDLSKLYPNLVGKVTIAIHDVAANVLSSFDEKLMEHALASFTKRGITIKTNSHITRVEPRILYTKEDGAIPFGMLIWATGNKSVALLDDLKVAKTDRLPRILTDSRLRVLREDLSVIDSAYALGDAADIKGASLPTTAEVACQKGKYLAAALTKNSQFPFEYQQKTMVAYVGGHDGVAEGKKEYSGQEAHLAWRALNLNWTWNTRKKFLISLSWWMNWLYGRDF